MKLSSVPFFLIALFLGVRESSAQMISIADSPTSQSATASGSFNISLSLSVPQGAGPSDVVAYDLYLVTASANTGYFSITAASPTGPFNSFGPDDSGGDPLNNDNGNGYVQNGISQGFTGAAQTVPFSDLALETLTLSVGANTPAGTYTFQTSTTATAGVSYTSVSDSSGNIYEVTFPGSFSVTVVPEPSALILAGVGVCGWIMLSLHRRRCQFSADTAAVPEAGRVLPDQGSLV